jgi:hypothetical protein
MESSPATEFISLYMAPHMALCSEWMAFFTVVAPCFA